MALVLGALVVVLAAAYVPELVSLGRDSDFTLVDSLPNVILSLAFGGAGLVVARRQPRNPIGWLLLAGAVLLMLSADATAYVALVYHFDRRDLPFGRVALLCSLLWAPAIALMPASTVFFPDGRLTSPRWRWVLRAYLPVAALWVACFYAVAVNALVVHRIAVNLAGDLTVQDNPTSGFALDVSNVETILQIVVSVFWVAMVGRVVVRYRRAVGERREQLKWLMSGAAITIVATVFVTFYGQGTLSAGAQTLLAVVSVAIIAAPVGMGVAILKYRLYEIDRLISRTLAYALLTGVLVGTFIGIVALTTEVLPLSSRVGVTAATLAAAGLFNPLRHRLQRLVDRRFNRARYDAEAIVAAFTASLRDAVELDAIRDQLLDVVNDAVQPTHASLWIRGGEPGAGRS